MEYYLFWHGPFSQWYDSPFSIGEYSYNTAEQYMMYQKAILFGDELTAKKILITKIPKEQKSLGRLVKGFDENLWEKHREQIVYDGNLAKFTQNPHLLQFLMNTSDATLVEASPVDKIWGIGLAEDHPDAKNPEKWRGLNLLGKVLTKVREDIRKSKNV